jgi:hypothetical protein
MINTRALAEYLKVEMLFIAVPRDLKAKRGMKLERDPRDPSILKYDKL